MGNSRNWAGNYTYSTDKIYTPENVDQVQQLVSQHNSLKVLGTRHSFNGIADSTECLLSLSNLNEVISLDTELRTVTVEAGMKYGDLGRYLHQHGYALHNMASLPHISVAGACATATHGSGDMNGSLASAVRALELVTADGEITRISREQQTGTLNGVVVGLGGFGVVTTVTLDVVPEFQVRQDVYENLPLNQLEAHFDDIFSSAYSVSLFTDWQQASFNQVWIKHRDTIEILYEAKSEFYGATLATTALHPVHGNATINCSEQMGKLGPSYERLPHFRMNFTPSNGAELQSEYIVPREHAYAAICAINLISEYVSPLVLISEIRTIAADDQWMSPFYKQHSVAIHFTWVDDWKLVMKVLPLIEEQLAPFEARPHWGKLFTMSPSLLQSRYEKLPDFQQLLSQYDPQGKFCNSFLNTYIMSCR